MTASGYSAESVDRVERATGWLTTAVVTQMGEDLPWFRDLPAEHRAAVGLVAQAGIAALVEWLRAGEREDLTKPVFGAAPRELVRAISLGQAVELVRLTVDVTERHVDDLAAPGETEAMRVALLRFSREVAFAMARVYAAAAEERGAWHARQRALLIEAVLRGDEAESLRAKASALGWRAPAEVAVVVGNAPDGATDDILDEAERICRGAGLEAFAGLVADRLVVIVGTGGGLFRRVTTALPAWGKGPVVVGSVVADVGDAPRSASAAQSGCRAVEAWRDAPCPVSADDLLAERALAGDTEARADLVAVYKSLAAGTPVLQTVETFLAYGGSTEATARALFLHPNTVRYRLRKAADASGLDMTDARDAFVAQVAIAVGRLST